MRQLTWLSWMICAGLAAGGGRTAAQDAQRAGPIPSTYALLVGSNPGGEGQNELQYAEEDARRMGKLLTELGRFPEAQTRVLVRPDKAQLLAALNEVGRRVRADHAQGRQTQFVFYYSGHARAEVLHLGRQELALSELRERILSLSSTLTLVVLDACQSGAFSSIKGAEPAAAFSYNSVSRLQTQGVAVIASSSESELSQESPTLHGSYFTHHFMVGLRGAGDRDRDGVVSLAEAYGYAYDRTLSSTARTRVGRQHVMLETSLHGHGDVPITYPAHADAQLELPGELEGDLIVEHEADVVAELHKARGSALRLALPAGAYTGLLRVRDALSECDLSLRSGEVAVLSTQACRSISEREAQAKGYLPQSEEDAEARRHELWSFELTFGFGDFGHDAYTRRLEDFAFVEQADVVQYRVQLAVARQFSAHFSLVTELRNYDLGQYMRDVRSPSGDEEEWFRWSSFGWSAYLRAHADVGDVLRFYAQLGPGLGYAQSKLDGHVEHDFGILLSGAAGISYTPARSFGFLAQASYAYAPVLSNELGDAHDSGGLTISVGMRLRTWSQP